MKRCEHDVDIDGPYECPKCDSQSVSPLIKQLNKLSEKLKLAENNVYGLLKDGSSQVEFNHGISREIYGIEQRLLKIESIIEQIQQTCDRELLYLGKRFNELETRQSPDRYNDATVLHSCPICLAKVGISIYPESKL